jgi:hypothetical protein
VWNGASVPLWENVAGIFWVSYDTGLLEKETPGFSPGSFIGFIVEKMR